ncbi:NADH dehydrogenase subunit J [Sulfobacillus acidophilus TPY]|jgi:NADH-quinone oxidoreductase subunit J|uniref:NADH-quinone oxidoreductase subunit J n=1 Tax=Sulfobacillus acidophilus (strain ATCC 700253 / DSM 10332 / NAL) TaxID=679936 RepID=G8TYH9_SULAD|nr:NADH dehydrogenase subunit J [Sulfobacillus acidophilus TPY]AEW06240.1 NADH-ubiquinone/plastoquinone oxidoreductase chain 6 [Sulfobacillus acidophilus DSM 10332]MCY0863715.1 NADH-quinone oxidoreductase subunit J [Sulfobacillus sp.]
MVGFLILAAMALVGGIGVITARQPVHSALYLIVNILALAIFYIVMNAEFLGVAQVIVYAGAIMVLFLFVVTLLTAGKDDREPKDGLPGQRLWAGILGVLSGIGLVYLGIRYPGKAVVTGLPPNYGNLHGIGQLLWGPDFIYLMAVAIMLLTAAVGVLVLNRPAVRRPRQPRTEEGQS